MTLPFGQQSKLLQLVVRLPNLFPHVPSYLHKFSILIGIAINPMVLLIEGIRMDLFSLSLEPFLEESAGLIVILRFDLEPYLLYLLRKPSSRISAVQTASTSSSHCMLSGSVRAGMND